MTTTAPKPRADRRLRPLPQLIFASRWLQLPLYLGRIVAQGVYAWQFWVELVHLGQAAIGTLPQRTHLRDSANGPHWRTP